MNIVENIKERYQQARSVAGNHTLLPMEQKALDAFNTMGFPTVKNEEWKYTRISSVINKDFINGETSSFGIKDMESLRLPGHEQTDELVFVNGRYAEHLSAIRSASLVVLPLSVASVNEYSEIVSKHLGHSGKYVKDGIHALNTAFVHQGIFIHIKKNEAALPVYIYHIVDARSSDILSQPRNLVYVSERSQVQLIETYRTLGSSESFTNQVMEIILEKEARVEYYKIQNDAAHCNQVSTTHFRQIGNSYIHAVTISLGGGIVRNNLNISMGAEHSEAHLYGLYYLQGETHTDNHTIVDNIKPNCFSNELYKGIIDDNATAVFNGKIFVQPQAQKTNAFQSNKNILLSDTATVNTKPQLEIFADDVKCSHGCTVGRLDEEGMFYLRSRGIGEDMARSLLVQAFAIDILDHIKPAPVREYVDQLISERLQLK